MIILLPLKYLFSSFYNLFVLKNKIKLLSKLEEKKQLLIEPVVRRRKRASLLRNPLLLAASK